MSALLQVENVLIRFRSKNRIRALIDRDDDPFIDAVCGVSLDVRTGETVALVGESGAGKTTLARSIIGLVTPQEGSIRFQEQELCGLSDSAFKPFHRDIAMMFQDPIGCLSPRLTVRSLVTEPFKIHRVKNIDVRAEAKRLLEMVGLTEAFASRYPHQLSGGMRQRVVIALAVCASPKLVIADEPTTALDVSIQSQIIALLKKMCRRIKFPSSN